jgi:hypothetical protein
MVTPLARRGWSLTTGVPLEVGGADVRENRWPQPKADSYKKDRIEDDLHSRICKGNMTVREAQRRFMKDWTTASR